MISSFLFYENTMCTLSDAYNHEAAEDTAVIYSLMGCCKAVGVDFKEWMNYFLNHVHEYDNDYSKDLTELLPHSLKAQAII